MWNYEKRLQYPVKITQTNPKIAKMARESASSSPPDCASPDWRG